MYDLKELGLNKLNYWGFENEWRYKISLMVAIHGSKNVIGKQFAVESPDWVSLTKIPKCQLGPYSPSANEFVTLRKIN